MIVSIILSILKIIGIILLCILGLLLLAVFVVLFVPIRYKVLADSNINDTDKEYHVTAKVSWLLHLVRGKYEYPSEEGFILKVGPFTVYGKKEKPEKEKKKKTVSQKKKEEAILKEQEKENVSEETKSEVMQSEEIKPEDTDILEDAFHEEVKEKSKRKTWKEKILYTRQKIYDKINKIRAKIKYILANIKKYINIIQSEEFQAAFALCKDSLIRLFKMIKPRKVKVDGTVGMKSPDQTGYVCAAIGVISPFFKKQQIHVIPDFENFIIKGNVLIKGRIYLFVVLVIAIKAFFDKNIRKVIEMFRKEENINE